MGRGRAAVRLSATALRHLPPGIERPGYDLGRVGVGHAHVGVGAFHRAHQAEYADDLLASVPGPWGIVGVNLRPPDLDATLAPQGGLYARVARDGSDTTVRVLGAMRRVAMGAAAGVAALADPAIAVVTLTVTEKGLCHVPATGALDAGHPDILHDATHPDRPRSAPGLLVAALARRRAIGGAAPARRSCANVQGNGRVLRAVTTGLAAMHDPDLAAWIDREAAFPASMVDRIVPATRDADLDEVAAALGLRDAAPVVCEPFRQWVVEDAFHGPRPPWERVGAEIVADVAPYEAMKMRLLNGCQSALAYLGWLAGCVHTADAMAVPQFHAFARDLMAREAAPTVTVPADLDAYRRSVLRRLANPALRHTTWQIATDGSQKIAQRLLAPMRARIAAGAPFPRLALAVAAWMQFASGRDLRGAAHDLPDALAPALRAATVGASQPDELVAALLRVDAIFGQDLRHDEVAIRAMTHALALLRELGAVEAAARIGEEGA